MSQPQFQDLTTIPTQQQVLDQEVLPTLASQPGGLQVTSWVLNGIYRSIAVTVAYLRVQARTFIATFTLAGFEDYIFGRSPTPTGADVTGWAPLTALNRYGLKQKQATYTLRTITLTNSSASAYNNLQSGAIILQFPSGNRYVLRGGQTTLAAAALASDTSLSVASTIGFPATGTLVVDSEQINYTGLTSNTFTGLVRGANGTTAAAHALGALVGQTISIPGNGSTKVTFRSEVPMAVGLTYNSDLPNSTLLMVTSSFPGVTATNPSTPYSPVSLAGSGLGQVTPSGTPSGNHQVTVQITQSGTVAGGTVGWATSLDGATFVPQLGSSVTLAGSIVVSLSDNGGSFVQGSYYYFSTPGSDITSPGAAIETPQALGLRAAGLWALLPATYDQNGNYVPPASPTASAYVALALSANQSVVNAFVQPDPVINNLLHLYLSGQGGAALPGSILAAEQVFFNAFNMVTDQIVCQTPTGRSITLALSSGAIQCKSTQLGSAQAAMTQRLQAYFGGTDPVTPLGDNGTIDYAYVYSLMRTTPGVTHVPANALTINGVVGDFPLPVTAGAVEVAQWTQTAASAFAWLPV
jgi:hypothetical protein